MGIFGDRDDAAGAENRVAAHGGVFQTGGELFDVSSGVSNGSGEFTDNAGSIISDNIDGKEDSRRDRCGFFSDGLDDNAFGGEFAELFNQRIDCFFRTFDADDACKLSGEPGHAAFEPISAIGGDGIGNGADQTGSIRSEDSHHEGFHHDLQLGAGSGGGQSGYWLEVICYWGRPRPMIFFTNNL